MTNGIVSVVRGNIVLLKAVAGCDGYNAEKLARLIREDGLTTKEQVYAAAIDIDFGCEDCLVVQDAEGFVSAAADELSALYAENFLNPRFNPRWECGICEHVEIVEGGEE